MKSYLFEIKRYMELIIENNEGIYKNIDSWGDLLSECKYKLIKIIIKDSNLDLKIKLNNGNLLNEINLSKLQMKNLKSFLEKQINEKSNLSNLQCLEFCFYINGINSFNEYKKEKINFINNINKGDSIVICEIDNKENNLNLSSHIYIKKPFFHFAISLGNGLFISKFGKGNIYITTFEEMHKIYNYSNFYILKNK